MINKALSVMVSDELMLLPPAAVVVQLEEAEVLVLLAVAVAVASPRFEPVVEHDDVAVDTIPPEEVTGVLGDDMPGWMVKFDFVFIKLLAASFNCRVPGLWMETKTETLICDEVFRHAIAVLSLNTNSLSFL